MFFGAFLAAVYSDYLSKAHAILKCPDAQVQPQELLNFAKSQALTMHLSFFVVFRLLYAHLVSLHNHSSGVF